MNRAQHLHALLHESAAYRDPNPGRSHITGQLHALRCGALMADHGEEAALVGLVHDLARALSDTHHGEVIAEIVRDRVSEHAYQALRDHGTMQAAAIRGNDLPDPSRLDQALCDAELQSFERDYHGPQMQLHQARQLITEWLN